MTTMNPARGGTMAGRTAGQALAHFWSWLRAQSAARRSMQHARTLDDRLLEDVGLTRADLRRDGYFDCFGR